MKISGNEFRSAVHKLHRVTSTNPSTKGGDLILLSPDGLAAFNGYFSAKIGIDLSIGDPICVRSKHLLKVVDAYKEAEELDIKVDDVHLIIKAGKRKSKIFLIEDFDLEPKIDSIFTGKDGRWIAIPKEELTMIGVVLFDNRKSNLSGIFFSGTEMIATDKNTIFHYTTKDMPNPFWMRYQEAHALSKIEGIANGFIDNNWLFLKTEFNDMYAICGLLCNSYPTDSIEDIRNNIGDEYFSGTFPDDTIERMSPIYEFADSKYDIPIIELSFIDSYVIMKAQNRYGEATESFACGFMVDEPITVKVTLTGFTSAISISKKFSVVAYKSDRYLIVFEAGDWKGIIATDGRRTEDVELQDS